MVVPLRSPGDREMVITAKAPYCLAYESFSSIIPPTWEGICTPGIGATNHGKS